MNSMRKHVIKSQKHLIPEQEQVKCSECKQGEEYAKANGTDREFKRTNSFIDFFEKRRRTSIHDNPVNSASNGDKKLLEKEILGSKGDINYGCSKNEPNKNIPELNVKNHENGTISRGKDKKRLSFKKLFRRNSKSQEISINGIDIPEETANMNTQKIEHQESSVLGDFNPCETNNREEMSKISDKSPFEDTFQDNLACSGRFTEEKTENIDENTLSEDISSSETLILEENENLDIHREMDYREEKNSDKPPLGRTKSFYCKDVDQFIFDKIMNSVGGKNSDNSSYENYSPSDLLTDKFSRSHFSDSSILENDIPGFNTIHRTQGIEDLNDQNIQHDDYASEFPVGQKDNVMIQSKIDCDESTDGIYCNSDEECFDRDDEKNIIDGNSTSCKSNIPRSEKIYDFKLSNASNDPEVVIQQELVPRKFEIWIGSDDSSSLEDTQKTDKNLMSRKFNKTPGAESSKKEIMERSYSSDIGVQNPRTKYDESPEQTDSQNFKYLKC